MMIKGSLLCSIHIVKRFWQKFSKSKIGPKNWGFVGFGRGKILTLTMRPPRKSIPTETRHLTQKNGVDPCKNVVSRGGQEIL